MGLRLVNTAPGEVTDPVKPGQTIHMGLRSETLSVQLATLNLDVGVSSFIHGGVLPEADSSLSNIGVTTAFETSERRRPQAASATKIISSGSLVLTKTTNGLDEAGIYELSIPIGATSSLLGHFKFRKKTAWTVTANPDWCPLTNMTGMYFGVEHGGFNTAAYAFLRKSGTGVIPFSGPLQSYSTARPGLIQYAYPWVPLADNDVLELFIFINTLVTPFRAELWTQTAANAAPVLLGTVPLSALGTFPNSTFTNSRPGVSNTATLFFGNIGQTGDILQLDDWALYPDYRAAVRSGQAYSHSSMIVAPDAPVEFRSSGAVLPEALAVSRWFPATGGLYTTPSPSFFYSPGKYLKPRHMSLSKSVFGSMALKRTEPRLESLQDGFMVEAFLAGTSTSKVGDLVGPGFAVEDGQKSYKLVMLETTTQRNYGIASDDSTSDDASTYHRPSEAIDWSSLKLLRMTVDRRRSKVSLHLDEEKVLDLPISTPAQVISETQTVPTTSLIGTDLVIEISDDGGGSPVTRTHTFTGEFSTIADIVADMMTDAVFVGAGSTEIEILDRGDSFSIRTVQTGPLMTLLIDSASTAFGAGKLIDLPQDVLYSGAESDFPAAPDAIGKILMGHPYPANYEAELKLDFLTYLPRYLAWEGEDSFMPNSPALDSAVQFTKSSAGSGGESVSTEGASIVKAGFLSNSEYRYFKKNQSFNSLGGIQVDFGVHVVEYTDGAGQVSAADTAISAGLTLFLGNKRVFVGFYDCGAMGRKIGIVPGSGSDVDIMTQTALGKNFSAAVDWSLPNKYRISVRPNDSIKVWSGSVIGDPLITIPWRNAVDGFDLPLDVTSPAVAFGHFPNFLTTSSSSTTLWKYVRWGYSNGFDVAVQQTYPNGYPKYLFGGREFILSEFDES